MTATSRRTARCAYLLLAGTLLFFALQSTAQEDTPGAPPYAAPGAPAPATGTASTGTDASGSGATAPNPSGLVKGAFSSTIEFVSQQISKQTGKNIVPRGKTVGQRVQLLEKDTPLETVLNHIVGQHPNWLWYKPEEQPNTYEIWDQESFRTEVLPRQVRQKVFIPREIPAEDAYKAITGVLTPNIGTASYDARSNKVIVTDLPYVLELIQRLIEAIDVKFITRVFYIAHADVNTIAEKISNLKSPAAPAPEVDIKTHQIIVRDRLDVIRTMELLVETLDIGPEIRVYDLNNLGWDGANRADIEEVINRVITPDALMQINVQAGKLLVEDVPEVHEKIEKVLAAFDQPAKQVLIQAEIIETTFQEGFNWTIDYTISGDLFSSVIDGLTGAAGVGGPTVPTGKQTVTPDTLGFLDFRKEFPIATGGSSGLNAQWLSRHAFISLKTAMTDSRTRVLQQPYALIKNQEEVTFNVGQRIPYYSGGTVGYPQQNVPNQTYYSNNPQLNFVQSGLEVGFRPSINNNNLIEMEVDITNNAADLIDVTFAGQAYTAPQVSTQELNSIFIIPTGETRVIGGLIREASNTSRKGIPGLIKIPVIGPMLFGSYNKPDASNGRRNLLMFITPTIILEQPAQLHKYKGRIVVDENAMDVFTTPTATMSDVMCEPLPVALPEPAREPVELLPPDKSSPLLSPAEEGTAVEKATTRRGTTGEPVESTVESTTENVLPLDQGAEVAPAPGGFRDLQRIHVAEQASSSTIPAMLPRIPGPSGALTGAGATGAARPGGPATGAPATGAPVGTPAVTQPVRTPPPQPAVVAPAQPAATTPAPAPGVETKM